MSEQTTHDPLAVYREARSEEARWRQEQIDAENPPPTQQQILAWRGDYGSSLRRLHGGWVFVPPAGWEALGVREHHWQSWEFRTVLAEAARLDAKTYPLGFHSVSDQAIKLRRIVRTGWNSAKKRAAKYKLPFSISPGDADALLWSQLALCAVSGVEFSTDGAGKDHYRAPLRPSLDRIDPGKGYEKGNIRLVLTLVNLAMNDWGSGPLIDVARAIVAKHGTGKAAISGEGL